MDQGADHGQDGRTRTTVPAPSTNRVEEYIRYVDRVLQVWSGSVLDVSVHMFGFWFFYRYLGLLSVCISILTISNRYNYATEVVVD